MPLERGRGFNNSDQQGSAPTAIVNQALARRLFGSDDVVGRNLRVGREKPREVAIVGVAYDGKYSDVTEAPQPYLFLPLGQYPSSELTLIAVAPSDARPLLQPVRRSMSEVDRGMVQISTHTLADHMHFATYSQRLAAWLTASLGALALLLTMIGLYGVTAYTVARRTHEIGIRMALGAVRSAVFASVLQSTLRLALVGAVLGTGLALELGRVLGGLLLGVSPMDPWVLSFALALVLLLSVAASIAPARRAIRVQPAEALREQ